MARPPLRTGLDRLLEQCGELRGRRYGVLAHSAAVSRDLVPIHLALARSGAEPARRLFAPEHGLYGVEQDMVASRDMRDPWTQVPVVSLYGDSKTSLKPDRRAFDGLDLVIIDLQDVGSRYYTYAATGVWTAEAALAAGCVVWILDRPNPLGGEVIEGNIRQAGYESFVGAFAMPVRHGLTLAELVRMVLRREGGDEALRVWPMNGWARSCDWAATGRPWVAPSPNIPTAQTAQVYPGGCLLEATGFSEGRGTTRPFELLGAPDLDAVALADALNARTLPGARFAPVLFKPQHQKHAGRACAGVQWFVDDPDVCRPYRCGVEILRVLHEAAPAAFAWRREPYEFESDRPAIDLLTGDSRFRTGLERNDPGGIDEWIAEWAGDEAAFRAARLPYLLYPEVEDERRVE